MKRLLRRIRAWPRRFRRSRPLPFVPHVCSICHEPIGQYDLHVGTGDGSMTANNGRGSFAHRDCYCPAHETIKAYRERYPRIAAIWHKENIGMKHYTAHDIELGRMRLSLGKPVEPELCAAILGEGIKTHFAFDGPYGSSRAVPEPYQGGVSVPQLADAHERPTRATYAVLDEVQAERDRQDARWGEQNHPSFPAWAGNPVSRAAYYDVPTEGTARARCENAFRDGRGSYADIFLEEVAEAIGASDEDRLRAELVQCAAVAVAWIEAIDRRKVKERAA